MNIEDVDAKKVSALLRSIGRDIRGRMSDPEISDDTVRLAEEVLTGPGAAILVIFTTARTTAIPFRLAHLEGRLNEFPCFTVEEGLSFARHIFDGPTANRLLIDAVTDTDRLGMLDRVADFVQGEDRDGCLALLAELVCAAIIVQEQHGVTYPAYSKPLADHLWAAMT